MTEDWKFFVLGRDRTPLPNCEQCTLTRHDPELCTCLTCHGFYAGTSEPALLKIMNELYPHNQWAVRTGSASGILVLDVEGESKDPAGYDTLDHWGELMGWHLPDVTCQSRSPSGGLHLYFKFPGTAKIPSRNRILPGVDLKADGGYVVLPHVNSPGRVWERTDGLTICPDEMVEWLATARGSGAVRTSSGRVIGYDYETFLRDGCPEGAREEFFNDLLFRLRKRGVGQQDAWKIAREQWERCEQPPSARWFWAWEHVVYKLNRIYATVEPTALLKWQTDWVAHLSGEVNATPRRSLAPSPRWSDID